MRHRRLGRVLGRSPSHRKALMRNMAAALFLTEKDKDLFLDEKQAPKVKGRIITTLPKAKELRPYVEHCLTIALRAQPALEAANKLGTTAERNTDAWKQWRKGPNWQKWAAAMSPVVLARRRIVTLLGDKEAAQICFNTVAPRFVGRAGGYTRIMKLATPRLGDAGVRAILEFVGVRDRAAKKAPAPKFEAEPAKA